MRIHRPLLLIDVDGVLSLFGFDHADPPPGRFAIVDGMPHWLSESAGPLLVRLAATFECVWCTGWEDRADEHLPALLGVPAGWPHLTFGDVGDGSTPGHWKLGAISAYVGRDRAVAWIDDAHDETCDAWAAQRPGATLLVASDPAVGITPAHASALEAWAAVVTSHGAQRRR